MESVPNSVNFVALEEHVLATWQREQTFRQSLAQRSDAPRYVFYDGPPFATGMPHYGHLLTSYMQDVVPRYQTMRGFYVPRRWGWDCHGLPAELEVEKELGLRADKDGVGPFNAACRSLVLRYADELERVMTRLGRWVDFDAYSTMDPDYTESVVWAFAELHRRTPTRRIRCSRDPSCCTRRNRPTGRVASSRAPTRPRSATRGCGTRR